MAPAKPLLVEGRVVRHQKISSVQKFLEVVESWFPGLWQTRHCRGDAIDGLSCIGFNWQQARHLGQDLPAWHIK